LHEIPVEFFLAALAVAHDYLALVARAAAAAAAALASASTAVATTTTIAATAAASAALVAEADDFQRKIGLIEDLLRFRGRHRVGARESIFQIRLELYYLT
jgi:hypothetical protein